MAFFEDHNQDYNSDSSVSKEKENTVPNDFFTHAYTPAFPAESQPNVFNVFNPANNMFSNNSFFPQYPHGTASGYPTTTPLTTDRAYMAGISTPAMNGPHASMAPMPNRPTSAQSAEYMQLQMNFMMLQTQMQAMAAQLAQRNESINESKPPVPLQDVKIKNNSLTTQPLGNFTDHFNKRSEYIRLTFPNANNKAELRRDQYTAVKYWTRDSWNEWTSKQPRSEGRARNAIPRHYYFLEDEHGELVSVMLYNSIRKYLRATFTNTDKYMPELLDKSWGKVDQVFQEAIKNEMSTRFPVFALCQGGWKVHNLLSKWYSSWRGRPGADSKSVRKGGSEDEGEATPGPDNTVITTAANVGSSGSDANFSVSKKHPRQEVDASTPRPVKKLKTTTKNPITSRPLKQKCVVITPAPMPLAQVTSNDAPGTTPNLAPASEPICPTINALNSPATPASPALNAPPANPAPLANNPPSASLAPGPPQVASPITSDSNVSPVEAASESVNRTRISLNAQPPSPNLESSPELSPTDSDTPPADPGAAFVSSTNQLATAFAPPTDGASTVKEGFGTDSDSVAPPSALNVPFRSLKTLAAVAVHASAESNMVGTGGDTENKQVGAKTRKGKKLTVPENSMTARNICARNWLQDNPNGLTETYKDYWNGLDAEAKAHWLQKEIEMKKTAKENKKKGK